VDHPLYQRSIDLIKANQDRSGAYVACPNFPTYLYCWLRDGSFIAHAMDRAGEHASARAFFHWVHMTITTYASKADQIECALSQNQPLSKIDFLHTRYTVAGKEVTTDRTWGNFQPDGYGTWLWALAEHITMQEDLSILDEVWDSVAITIRYLCAVWHLPTYDCWEEHPEYIHPYSLGAIYAGLRAAERLAITAGKRVGLETVSQTAAKIQDYLREKGIHSGRLVKSFPPNIADEIPFNPVTNGVDASLIALSTPYQVFQPDSPIFQATLTLIEQDLRYPHGGVYRYRADTYYGGGEWLLLTAWLGWHAALAGDKDKAAEILEWVEAQADSQGYFPEQISTHALVPHYLPVWQARWGNVARPLLWSHAMYLILYITLKENHPEIWTTSRTAQKSSIGL